MRAHVARMGFVVLDGVRIWHQAKFANHQGAVQTIFVMPRKWSGTLPAIP
jgi:hypothetical protein